MVGRTQEWNRIICQLALNPTLIAISSFAKPEHYQNPSGEPNFPTSTMAFPAPAEHDNMGEARSLSSAMIVLSLRAPLSGKERIRGSWAVCAISWVKFQSGLLATSDADRRVRETRWRRIDHLLTAGARLNARTSEKGARAHPNCAVPTLDAAHRKCKRGSNESYATS